MERRVAAAALGYWLLYVAYLFAHNEGEAAHWISLVVVPAIGAASMLRRGSGRMAWDELLSIIGLRRQGLVRAIALGTLLGAAFTVLQLFGKNGNAARSLFSSMSGWGWLAAGLLMMGFTAAATEEFFFRGVLQGCLTRAVPQWTAAMVATAAFVLYHVPYAYVNPRWASHGDFGAAISAAIANALVVGALLSGVYAIARRHIVAPWLAHALVNMVPGALYLQSRFGS